MIALIAKEMMVSTFRQKSSNESSSMMHHHHHRPQHPLHPHPLHAQRRSERSKFAVWVVSALSVLGLVAASSFSNATTKTETIAVTTQHDTPSSAENLLRLPSPPQSPIRNTGEASAKHLHHDNDCETDEVASFAAAPKRNKKHKCKTDGRKAALPLPRRQFNKPAIASRATMMLLEV